MAFNFFSRRVSVVGKQFPPNSRFSTAIGDKFFGVLESEIRCFGKSEDDKLLAKAVRLGLIPKRGHMEMMPNYDKYNGDADAKNKYFHTLETHVRRAEQSVNAIVLATQDGRRPLSSGSLNIMPRVGNTDGDAEANDKYVHFLEDHLRRVELSANAVALVARAHVLKSGSLNIMSKECNYDGDAQGKHKYIQFIESHFRRADQLANIIALVGQGCGRILRSGPLNITPKVGNFDGDAEAKEKYFHLLAAHIYCAERRVYKARLMKAALAHVPDFRLNKFRRVGNSDGVAEA